MFSKQLGSSNILIMFELLGYLIYICCLQFSYIIVFLFEITWYCVSSLLYYTPFIFLNMVSLLSSFISYTLTSLIQVVFIGLIFFFQKMILPLYQSTTFTQFANFFGKFIFTILIATLIIKLLNSVLKQALSPIIELINAYLSPIFLPFRLTKSLFLFVFFSFQNRNQIPDENIQEYVTRVQTERISDNHGTVRSNTEEDSMCVVCYSNRKSILMRPCNHACVCPDCADAYMNGTIPRQCPLCRVYIERTERIYI